MADDLQLHPVLKSLLDDEIPGQTIACFGSKKSAAIEQAYLFAAQKLKCSLTEFTQEKCADGLIFRPWGKLALHTIDEMRRLKEQALGHPYHKACKILIIEECERMQAASSNALLKLFEEPPPTTWLILLASRPEKILPTILSRAKKIFFPEKEQTQKTPLESTLIWQALLKDYRSLDGFTLQKKLKEIADALEEKKKHSKLAIPSSLKDAGEKFKEKWEKEEEARLMLTVYQGVDELFETLFQTIRATSLKTPEKIPTRFSIAEEAVQETRHGYERGLPLSSVLETLLFKIHKNLSPGS